MRYLHVLLSLAFAGSLFMNGCSETVVESPQCANPITDDSVVVRITRIIDGDTFAFMVGDDEVVIRLRMPNPRDTIDAFDFSATRAAAQAQEFGISVDSVRTLAQMGTDMATRLLQDKNVTLRRYPDLRRFADNFTYGRILRGVELPNGAHFGDSLRAARLTTESFR